VVRSKRFSLAMVAIAALAILATASLALAAETTREAYVATVEPVCKSNTQANEKILKGVKTEVKQGKLKPAGAQFSKAAAALKKTYAQLKAVPQPSADAAKLNKWLGYVKEEANLFEKTATALKAGNKNKAQVMVVKLTHNANLANDQVLSFNFKYCRFEPSKFT
jgi:hypothetical protein